jgi:hypothetical protein
MAGGVGHDLGEGLAGRHAGANALEGAGERVDGGGLDRVDPRQRSSTVL